MCRTEEPARAMGHRRDPSLTDAQADAVLPSADALLLAQLRAGEADAGRRFVREYYPGIYRHLLYLSGHREIAEDLTQETFFQAWRHLDRFEGRAPLGHWLHRIAHREFVRSLRSRRTHVPLAESGDLPTPHGAVWTEAVELRELIRKLPLAQREAVVLHYLGGHPCEEIAQIVHAPVGTIKYRLSAARTHLQRELGGGDLAYLNQPALPMRQWAWLPLDQMDALEARLVMGGAGAGATPGGGACKEESMERREFLRRSAAGAAGLVMSEKEVVDSRLTQKVTCAFKGTALANLCQRLQAVTGVPLAAGASVADEKVALFCEKLPLREVMRQLSRPFGYTWLRSEKPGDYRYELVQDLKSQLLEEELRNRDRNEALLALAREMDRYRPYLGLSPEEALSRAKTAGAENKRLLEPLGRYGWGPIQMYFRLSPAQLTALRAGEKLLFRPSPESGFQPLPPDLERGILQCQTNHRLVRSADGRLDSRAIEDAPDGLPVAAVSELRAQLSLSMPQSELGQFALSGECGFFGGGLSNWAVPGPWAVGISPTLAQPNRVTANARLSRDAALQRQVTVVPGADRQGSGLGGGHRQSVTGTPKESAGPTTDASTELELTVNNAPRVTIADVLEALHRTTGMPVVGDYYTRLYKPDAVSTHNQPLFEALNQLGDACRLRWNKEEDWLQFRSASFYNDRLKEVPNRLLSRWTASRREHGLLTLDDLVEIAQLSDAQLNAADMAEGAREYLGLKEWGLARDGRLRPHLRFLAGFTPAQRQKATRSAGLPFPEMPLAQQQRFLTLALGDESTPLQSLEELAGATLRVDYLRPDRFQWQPPGPYWLRWFAPLARDQRVLVPPIRERTRDAALLALRRLDPQIREAVRQAAQRNDPQSGRTHRDEEDQIVPTRMDVVFIYMPDTANRRSVHVVWEISDSMWSTW
jgi:RNA polymerase sigma-70 factor (ECF subfamily)